MAEKKITFYEVDNGPAITKILVEATCNNAVILSYLKYNPLRHQRNK